ncbi:MAG: hypothetical protein ABIK11_05130, partial [candidate division WOR-3 bacterium]
ASCYLKPEPIMLGTIKGEDFIKFLLIILISLIVLLGTAARLLPNEAPFLNNLFGTIVNWFTPKS